MQFIKARHFTPTSGRRIDLLVVHDMEAPETSDRAEACAQMFATTTREASAHYCLDNDSAVQCVADKDVAWAAPGGNSDGLQFEFAGYASQRGADWTDRYSADMLDRGADLFGRKAKEHSIPAVWLKPADLQAQKRGITSHWNISLAFRLSSHSDPGVNFPIERFIRQVRKNLGDDADRGPTHKASLPTIMRGDVGWLVKKAQRHLKAHGYSAGKIDGHFGQHTEEAVERFQRNVGIKVDGMVGPATWKALRS